MSIPTPSDSTGAAGAFSDGLGERLRAIGADGQALEVLKLRPEFMDAPAFEAALRERTARLTAFRDPAFASVIRIDRVPPLVTTLAIVSERVEGVRLSRVLEAAASGRCEVSFVTATGWLQQIASAITRLHAYGRDVAHGALAPERIVLTRDGRLVVVEPVLGAALEQLQWSRRNLWLALRVAMPSSAGMLRFDQRADLAQVGATALAILLGRPLRDADYPDGLSLVLREVSDRVAHANPAMATGFASWLVRTLQVEGRPFGSLKEAQAALEDLLVPSQRPAPAPPVEVPVRTRPVELLTIADSVAAPPAPAMAAPAASREVPPRAAVPAPRAASPVVVPTPSLGAPSADVSPSPRPIPAVESWPTVIRVALVLIVIGATTAAGTVRYLASRPVPGSSARPAAVTPPPPESRVRAKRPPQPARTSAEPAPATAQVPAMTPLPAEAPPALPQGGWLAIKAPVDVVVSIDGERASETRQGRFPLTAGAHGVEIVNDTLAFRQTFQVTVRPGEDTVLAVPLPFGVVDLNANPWAEVWLDGQRLGETPIGSLSVPIGPHEFVFRHPEFGERRYAVSVTAAEPVRLSVDFSKR